MSLIHETELNLYDFYKELAQLSSLESGVFEGVSYVKNQNGGWPGFLLADENAEASNLQLVAEAMENGRLPAFWLRKIKNDDFDSRALGSGIRMVNKWKGMEYYSEEPFPDSFLANCCEFYRVEVLQELNQWNEVVNSFRIVSSSINLEVMKKPFWDERFLFFGLKRDKELLSTMLLFIKDDVAGIYFVVTKEKERGKGYGSEIVRQAMNYCISKGIYKFVLHSTKMGYSVYRKLGFVENSEFGIYWKIEKY